MASSLRQSMHVDVTREMFEAAEDNGINENNIHGVPREKIAQIYRAMRMLEPGPACQGIEQVPGANPYAAKR